MSRLFRVELRRLLARRLLRFTTLVVVALLTIAGAIVFFTSDMTPAEVERVQNERLQSCVESQGFGNAPPGTTDFEAFCREDLGSEIDPRLDYVEVADAVTELGFPFMMLGWILGASSIGAEWNNRTLTTTLTWESRRVRVLVAKMLALVLVVAVWILLLLVFYALAMYPAAAAHGITSTVDSTVLGDMFESMLRVDALAVVFALLGFALATMGRNTAAALGVGFAYLAVVETIIRGFKPEWSDWLLGDNISLFLFGVGESPLTHGQTTAAVILVAYIGALLLAATALFRRREMA
ncbi:MAG TPA: ABC transporter permease subunit [Actinomycetota bacterium]|nr:ABC transporter permease subunit [Actinomycetota bacterium]